MQYLCMISILALCHQPSPIILHKYNTRLAFRSSYTLPPIRTNNGKFSIKFQGAKMWNSLSEETKSLHRLAFKKILKKEIIQSYWYTIKFYSSCSQYLIHKYINSFTIPCHYSCIVNIIVFCENYYCYFFILFCYLPHLLFLPWVLSFNIV